MSADVCRLLRLQTLRAMSMVVKLKDFSLSLWASVLIVCRCVVSTVVSTVVLDCVGLCEGSD